MSILLIYLECQTDEYTSCAERIETFQVRELYFIDYVIFGISLCPDIFRLFRLLNKQLLNRIWQYE